MKPALHPRLSAPLPSLLAALCAQLTLHAAEPPAKAPPEYFQDDSRRWSQSSKAVVHLDLGKMEPAAALITGKRQKGKWKMIPFATAEWRGSALSIYGATNPPVVHLALAQRGWHAVYIGLATTSGGFNIGGNGIKARLSDEPVFKRVANNLALLENRRAVIQECFLTVAELNGQSLEIAPLPGLPATVCYAKLVPLTEAEVRIRKSKPAASSTRSSIATFDGHSWIWPFRPTTAAELAEEFRGFEDTDIGKWWFQVTGADLVCYPSKVGTYPGEGTTDFPTGAYAACTRSLETLFKKGINPLKVARDAAKAQGAEFHVMLRPAGWVGSMPYEETFNSKFFYRHHEGDEHQGLPDGDRLEDRQAGGPLQKGRRLPRGGRPRRRHLGSAGAEGLAGRLPWQCLRCARQTRPPR